MNQFHKQAANLHNVPLFNETAAEMRARCVEEGILPAEQGELVASRTLQEESSDDK